LGSEIAAAKLPRAALKFAARHRQIAHAILARPIFRPIGRDHDALKAKGLVAIGSGTGSSNRLLRLLFGGAAVAGTATAGDGDHGPG
jgi:hypothetical protein